MNRRRNVLFIVIDQLRADCLHGALAAHLEMPNLRAFMEEAVTFTRHFSVTSPCGPARASLLTGQYAMNHRATRNGTPLPHDKPNLATEVRKGGWLPLLYGYTDSAQDPRAYPPGDPALTSYEQVMPGFVEAVEMRLEESWPWRAHLLSKGLDVPEGTAIFRPEGDRIDDPALYPAEDSDTAYLTDRLIADLRARPQGWFAHLTWIRPHPPLVAPAPYNRMYDPAAMPPPLPARASAHPFDRAARAATNLADLVVGFPDLPDTPETVAQLRALYFALATEVDHHFGRLVAFLKDTGQWEDTLIVVTGDHGEMLGDHGLWGKMSYHDASFHVPLMIRDPRLPGALGRRVDLPTESVDVTPTILDLLGCEVPDTMDGHSLRPFLEGRTPPDWRKATFSEIDFGNPLSEAPRLGLAADRANLCIWRDERHTLVHFNAGLPPLVFDHARGGEARDIAGEGNALPLLLDLTRAVLDHRMTHAEGRFARTLITPDGPRRGPSAASPDLPPARPRAEKEDALA